MSVIASNGIQLTYDTHGDPAAEPLLLIMGLGMQMTGWPEEFCAGLAARGFYVIRFDNRDCGLSTSLDHLGKPNLLLAFARSLLRLPLNAPYKLDDMARDTLGLLDALGIARAHVVGASMGGMIAQIVAARYPERVRSLTSIMSTSGRRGLPGPTPAARRAIMAQPPDPHDMETLVNHMMRTFRVISSPAYPVSDAVLRERMQAAIRRKLNPAGVARQLVAIAASGDRVALLRSIKTAALIIHGKADLLLPIACGRDTARLIPGATMHEIDGMGHDLPPALLQTIVQLIGAHCAAH